MPKCPKCGNDLNAIATVGEVGKDAVRYWGCPACLTHAASDADENNVREVAEEEILNHIEDEKRKGFGDRGPWKPEKL